MEEEDVYAIARSSPIAHFATCTQILDKSNELISPKPNILQRRMSEAYEALMLLEIPARIIVCKPRQVGCSTFATHIAYHHCRKQRTTGIVISDLSRNSQKLLEKVRDYQFRDRMDWGVGMRERAGTINWTNGSELDIDSAENSKAGIGRTRQLAICSEIGKWPKTGIKNDKRLMEAMLPSIAKKPGTVVIAESTPEGSSGWMYETYMGAKDRPGAMFLDDFIEEYERTGKVPGNGWVKVFGAWWEFEEHQIPVNEYQVERMKATMTESEAEEVKAHDLTWSQLAWRRYIIDSECSGSESAFFEYYPPNDQICWLVSGRPRFNMGAIAMMERQGQGVRSDVGFLTPQWNETVTWAKARDGRGDIEIWEPPREGMRYLVACDPATGVDQTESKDPDRHSVLVFRAAYATETGEDQPIRLVARVRAPFQGESDQVAEHIVNLSLYYGRCLVVLETNMGLHILELLKDRGVPLYHRIVNDDLSKGTKSKRIGFKLKDANLRRSVVDMLATHIREGGLQVECPHWLQEAKSFIITKTGREEARPGTHDDDILCSAMALYSMSGATLYKGAVRRRHQPRDINEWTKTSYVHHLSR